MTPQSNKLMTESSKYMKIYTTSNDPKKLKHAYNQLLRISKAIEKQIGTIAKTVSVPVIG